MNVIEPRRQAQCHSKAGWKVGPFKCLLKVDVGWINVQWDGGSKSGSCHREIMQVSNGPGPWCRAEVELHGGAYSHKLLCRATCARRVDHQRRPRNLVADSADDGKPVERGGRWWNLAENKLDSGSRCIFFFWAEAWLKITCSNEHWGGTHLLFTALKWWEFHIRMTGESLSTVEFTTKWYLFDQLQMDHGLSQPPTRI